MKVRSPIFLAVLAAIVLCVAFSVAAYLLFHEKALENLSIPGSTFLVKPYIQLGSASDSADLSTLELHWQTDTQLCPWQIDVRQDKNHPWQRQAAPEVKQVSLTGLLPRRIYRAVLHPPSPGQRFDYRLLKNESEAFAASVQARKTATQPYRFVVFGDLATGSTEQKQVAAQAYSMSPDMVLLLGDIVYQYGTFIEYLKKFFPVYNADSVSADNGVPFLRSTLFVAAPGNHDISKAGIVSVSNLDRFPSGLAYFTLWSQPLNGPLLARGQDNTPPISGKPANCQAFADLAGDRYPLMANFSFNYGNSHWLVLDGNDYVNWSNAKLRLWVEQDLKSSQSELWHFVAFHQAPFSSGNTHAKEQRMRLLCDLFQKYKVDIVFSGHIHNYQRTYPLHFFKLQVNAAGQINADGTVPGKFQLDGTFNGQTKLKPDGTIYIVSGAGGARLSDTTNNNRPATWQPYTCKLISDRHSFTVCDIAGLNLTCRQISAAGQIIDQFKIEKKRDGTIRQ